jgi:hypothetical protein
MRRFLQLQNGQDGVKVKSAQSQNAVNARPDCDQLAGNWPTFGILTRCLPVAHQATSLKSKSHCNLQTYGETVLTLRFCKSRAARRISIPAPGHHQRFAKAFWLLPGEFFCCTTGNECAGPRPTTGNLLPPSSLRARYKPHLWPQTLPVVPFSLDCFASSFRSNRCVEEFDFGVRVAGKLNMMSSRQSPIWPYLVVLAGLFVLSIVLPSGWQTDQRSHATVSTYRPRQTETARPRNSQVAIVSPAPASAALPQEVVRSNSEVQEDLLQLPSADNAGLSRFQFTGPIAEVVAKRIADLRRFANPQELLSKVKPPADRAIEFPPTNFAANPFPATRNWLSPTTSQAPAFRFPLESPRSSVALDSHATTLAELTRRPMPTKLIAQLNWLAQFDECNAWAVQVQTLCSELCRLSLDDVQRSNEILNQLKPLVETAGTLAATISSPQAAAELRRARYAVERRLAIWEIANSGNRTTSVYANMATGAAQRQRLSQALNTADTYLRSIPYGDAWRNYLQLDDVAVLTNLDGAVAQDDARFLARRIITRLSPSSATLAQRKVLQDANVAPLAEVLRPWATEPADFRELMVSLEQYEASGLASDAKNVVAAQRRMQWSSSDGDRQFADRVDEHYRNANVRMTFTAALLNRLMPEPLTVENQVNDRILGNPVSGTSDTTTQLQVKLIPDPQRLHIWLEAHGTVDSRTQSSKGPVTVSDRGESNYIVYKAVVLDDRGLGIAKAIAEATSDTQLTGISTTFDNRPVIGHVVRNRAEEHHDRQSGLALKEVEQKVATQASRRVDVEAGARLATAENAVRHQIVTPLENLGVNSDPISLETTAERLTMRLRLAGANQLGGHTARPQAPSDSLASMQVHESALNNVLDQLQLAGKTATLPELFQQLSERTGRDIPSPVDLPSNITITFAQHDAVRVRCQDGGIRVTLAIASFGDGSQQWHDFMITATYVPEIDHLHARLVRQGPIELGGEAYKGQPEVKLRAIFAKVLPRDRKLDLVPDLVAENPQLADLCLTQCVIDDGWIGIALGPDRTVARRDLPNNSVMISK